MLKQSTETKPMIGLGTSLKINKNFFRAESQFSSAREDVLKELAKHKPLSASDSQIEVREIILFLRHHKSILTRDLPQNIVIADGWFVDIP